MAGAGARRDGPLEPPAARWLAEGTIGKGAYGVVWCAMRRRLRATCVRVSVGVAGAARGNDGAPAARRGAVGRRARRVGKPERAAAPLGRRRGARACVGGGTALRRGAVC
jgi:hypothetical protein